MFLAVRQGDFSSVYNLLGLSDKQQTTRACFNNFCVLASTKLRGATRRTQQNQMCVQQDLRVPQK